MLGGSSRVDVQLWVNVGWLFSAGTSSDALSIGVGLGQRAQAVHGVILDVPRGTDCRGGCGRSFDVDRQLHAVLRQTDGRCRGRRAGRCSNTAQAQGSQRAGLVAVFTVNQRPRMQWTCLLALTSGTNVAATTLHVHVQPPSRKSEERTMHLCSFKRECYSWTLAIACISYGNSVCLSVCPSVRHVPVPIQAQIRQWLRDSPYDSSGIAKGGEQGAQPPILQTKHKHTYKLHKIFQFGQFIFGKIIKIVATRSHLLKLKCTKFDFGWDSAPDPAGGAQRSPRLPGWILEGLTSKGKWGERKKGEHGKARRGKRERGRKERDKRGKGRGGKGRRRETKPPQLKCLATPLYDSLESLVFRDKILCRWVRESPRKKKKKEGPPP